MPQLTTPVDNRDIAGSFEVLADLLEIEGANPFRIRAYRDAARTVRNWSQSLSDMVREQADLSELPGVGRDLAQKIKTLVETGRLPLLDEVAARVPPGLSELMRLQGLGPKRTKTLHEKLGVNSLEDLKRVAQQGKIATLQGFGEKTQKAINERLANYAGERRRIPLAQAEHIAPLLLAYLRASKGIGRVDIAGSYRRRREDVGDLDILITVKPRNDVMERFVRYPEVAEVLAKGATRSTVRLQSGLQVDVRAVAPLGYGAALNYFTGSKAHNIAVRKLGVKLGYKINEYGVFQGARRIGGKTEREVYRMVKLPYIAPELRENRGEIEAAQTGRLPKLIAMHDIRGDLHAHSNASDGHNSLQEMARAAAELGYEYLAITDHSQRVTIAHGLDKKRVMEQIKAIDKLNEQLNGIVLLKSAEVDILEDGSLDLPEEALRELDLTVCSVHYGFSLPSQQQSERIIRAMDNPYFNILGHPHGRLLGAGKAYAMETETVLRAAKERGCIVELNANPKRLDLNDSDCLLAKQIGTKIAISTDSHSAFNLEYMRFGIDQARRGWLDKNDVINTRPLPALRRILNRH